jgi:hypothetical protein
VISIRLESDLRSLIPDIGICGKRVEGVVTLTATSGFAMATEKQGKRYRMSNKIAA